MIPGFRQDGTYTIEQVLRDLKEDETNSGRHTYAMVVEEEGVPIVRRAIIKSQFVVKDSEYR